MPKWDEENEQLIAQQIDSFVKCLEDRFQRIPENKEERLKKIPTRFTTQNLPLSSTEVEFLVCYFVLNKQI